jgi:MFS family permease
VTEAQRPNLAVRFLGVDGGKSASLIALAALGVFFAADDQTSVVAVLPKMIGGINLPQDQFYRAAWIVNAYILGYVVAMPIMGRISDRVGHGRVFAASLGVFMVGSAWVALSHDLTMVSIARAFQAVGGGASVPVAMAIVADAMPEGRRAIGIGAIAAATEAGGLIGPLDGGVVGEILGWRAVFWENIPLCLPIAITAWRMADRPARSKPPIDFGGGGLFGASLVCLTVALTNDPIQPRSAEVTLSLYALAVAFFALFILRQTRTPEPLVELAMFRRVPLSAGFATMALHGGISIVAMVNVPLFTNIVLQGSALDGGLNLMRMTIALPLGAVLGGYGALRLGLNRTAIAGALTTGVGFLGMSRWSADPDFVAFTLPLLVAGAGLGLMIAPIGTAVLNEVSEGRRATVSCLLSVVDLLGSLVGVALLTTRGLGAFYASAGLIPLDDPRYADLLTSLQVGTFGDTFFVTALICFLAVIPAYFLGSGLERHLTWKDVRAAP